MRDKYDLPEADITGFKNSISTAAVEENLRQAPSLESFFKKNDKYMHDSALPEYLKQKLKEKGLRRADVIQESGLDRGYVYEIFAGKKKASRDKLIAIAFGLHLTLEETQRMLKLAGYSPLYSKSRRDIIIYYSLYHNKSIRDTEIQLYDAGFDPLVDVKE